jgi:hypothetical protein
MKAKWIKGGRNSRDRKAEQRAGIMAGNTQIDNCCEIESSYHHSGSGPVNGCSDWPHLSVNISFCEGEEKKRDNFAKKIKDLIDKELPFTS